MSEELRTLSAQTLSDAIRLMNESSRGTSLECQVDLFGFLALWRFWNFSHHHSLLCYVEAEPAALILTCADPEARDAYIFYWGALPKFRKERISMRLVETCCNQLRDNDYTVVHANSAPDRPVQRYRFVHFQPQYDLVDMEAASPVPPGAKPAFEVRPIDIDAVSAAALSSGELLHWSQRPAFLRNAAACCRFLGAFAGGALQAYMVIQPSPSNTILLDLRSPANCFPAGQQLLCWLSLQNFCLPLVATCVLVGSYAYRLLGDAGFAVKREFSTLRRDLRAPAPATTASA